MSIYLDEKNPGKHKPFDDAAPDIVEYVRYLEVIAGKSATRRSATTVICADSAVL